MSIGASLILIALGAILKFGVDTQHSHGFDIGTIGIILMIVGGIGLVITLVWTATRRRTHVISRNDGVNARTTVYEPNDDPANRY
ncbi:MAG TPA: hypothetical protein VGL26_04305 [Jatrophihabitans sp.]